MCIYQTFPYPNLRNERSLWPGSVAFMFSPIWWKCGYEWYLLEKFPSLFFCLPKLKEEKGTSDDHAKRVFSHAVHKITTVFGCEFLLDITWNWQSCNFRVGFILRASMCIYCQNNSRESMLSYLSFPVNISDFIALDCFKILLRHLFKK